MVEDAKKDPQKFAALYDKYFDQIYRYVFRRCSDKETVHDLVSQTFYDALSHMKDYEWRGFSFSAWLYKIAHNNVLKWYRQQGRVKKVDFEEEPDFRDDKAEDVLDTLKKKDLQDEVAEVMEKLDPQDREIIKLKFFEEVSNVEIAQIMGLSANHIGVKVFRALKKVKQLLK